MPTQEFAASLGRLAANHLWQSTLFAAVAWLLTLALRKNRAAVRYWIWLAASVKFLIPFSLLVSAGAQLGWRTAACETALRCHTAPEFSSTVTPFCNPEARHTLTHGQGARKSTLTFLRRLRVFFRRTESFSGPEGN